MARKRSSKAKSKSGRKYRRKGGKWVRVTSYQRHPPHRPAKYPGNHKKPRRRRKKK